MMRNFRTWIIRIMVTLITCAVVSYVALMIIAVIDGHGIFPIVPNPMAKGGYVLPITIVVLVPVVLLVLGYAAILRLLRRYRSDKPLRHQDRS